MPSLPGSCCRRTRQKCDPAVNLMGDDGNYCSDRGDGAADGEEM
jgi:hypothetical protein